MTTEELFEKYPNILVYDFEVFIKFWCVVIASGQGILEITDRVQLRDFYEAHRSCIWIGYNSNHYDQYIMGAIYNGFQNETLYRVSQDLIEEGRTKRGGGPPEGFISYDTGDKFRSLKELEAFMGHSIEESSIPFDYDGEFTEEMKAETLRYCRHDVLETVEVLKNRIYDFMAQKSLIETFGLPETDYRLTKAQLTAKVLKCRKAWELDNLEEEALVSSEWDNRILDCVHITKYPEVLEFYSNRANYMEGTKEIMISGVPHTFALGGIHGAIKRCHRKGQLLHIDVTSYYPSIMIQHNLLTRRSKEPGLFTEIYNKRVELKKAGKKQEQAPYKIILNSTFGITNHKYSDAYDPQRNHDVCINGQLMLLMLLEMLEGTCDLIQSNTDGIIVDCTGRDQKKVEEICHQWEKETKMGLSFEQVSEIWQKDVNNYLIQFEDGKEEAKGAYVKFNSDLDNDMSIVNEAVREGLRKMSWDAITEYIEKHDRPEDLVKFQKIVKLSSRYSHVYFGRNEIRNHKCFRVFAVCDGEILSKAKSREGTHEKYANTPESATIVFGDLGDPNLTDIMGRRFGIKDVDKQYYIELARSRAMDFGLARWCSDE
jgi:DNA polymerase